MLKVGIIGAGGIAGAHLPHLAANPEVELAAIADISAAAAQTQAEKFGIARVAADFRDWLPDVDALLVCVPTWLHAEIAVAALRAGKAVFCEKPMARSAEQAEAMLEAANAGGAPLQIGFVRRFDAEWLAWREAVLAGKIGRPVIWRDVMAGPGPEWAPWFNDDAKGGGPFLDGCIHNLDFALFTFGPAQWVFAHGRTLQESHTAIDSGSATIRFHSGDELLLAWSWGLPQGCAGGRVFEIFGPHGIVKFPGGAADEQGNRRFVVDGGTPGGQEEIVFPANALGKGFKEQMDEFIAVALRERAPRAGGREGLAALQLALAILQSARSGEKVVV